MWLNIKSLLFRKIIVIVIINCNYKNFYLYCFEKFIMLSMNLFLILGGWSKDKDKSKDSLVVIE